MNMATTTTGIIHCTRIDVRLFIFSSGLDSTIVVHIIKLDLF